MFETWVDRRRQPHRHAARRRPRGPARADRRRQRPLRRLPADRHRRRQARRRARRPDDPVPRHRGPLRPDAGRRALATLYSNATTATANPAVTLRTVGSNGGQAAAFTYDLARSVVYTRQGNPAWAGQERDGEHPADPLRRPVLPGLDRLRQGPDPAGRRAAAPARQPHRAREPRPDAAAAVLVLPARREGRRRHDRRRPRRAAAPRGQFDWVASADPAGCDVVDWECVRATSYIYQRRR